MSAKNERVFYPLVFHNQPFPACILSRNNSPLTGFE